MRQVSLAKPEVTILIRVYKVHSYTAGARFTFFPVVQATCFLAILPDSCFIRLKGFNIRAIAGVTPTVISKSKKPAAGAPTVAACDVSKEPTSVKLSGDPATVEDQEATTKIEG
jgi:hypothetical protein